MAALAAGSGRLAMAAPKGNLPGFDGASAWLNSVPLREEDLRGKPVLVNFCTYTCINWLRSLPWVRAWAGQYRSQGLVTIGVHSPEFSFEKDLQNVKEGLQPLGLDYAIAVDSNHAVWRDFDNQYWPALYLADAQGRIRHRHFGEGGYEKTERVIQKLLKISSRELVSPAAQGMLAQADWDNLKSPENYLGVDRTENFASPGGLALNHPRVYALPESLQRNQWALAGTWITGPEASAASEPGGRLACRFHARHLHLVMGPGTEKPLRYRVLLNGQPPGAHHGLDIDEQGMGTLKQPRLHQLIRQRKQIDDARFEIEFLDPGARIYAFTFG